MSTMGIEPGEDPVVERELLVDTAASSTPRHELWRRFRRNRVAMVALCFIVVLIALALLAPLLAPYGPTQKETLRLNEGPSGAHWLGTDDVGQDILTRVIYGARVSLRAAFQIVGMALAVALPIGLVAGYVGGRVDGFVMRVMDALFAFPPLLFALAISGLLGPGLNNAFIAIAVVFVPGFVRLIRGQVLAIREETYVEASRAIGVGTPRMLRRHLLPNIAPPLVVQVALSCGFAILAEAGLSFLGYGAPLGTPSWGTMLRRAYDAILVEQWTIVPPGVALLLTVLAFNLIGDGLRDALGRGSTRMPPR
jgi:ABC-type dipeptide/oligopeptide/nickel transport system permease subunit